MPRAYNLGLRAAPKAEVRARIVAAALEIYRERGVGAASNLAIARAADVAPATVRNHFPVAADLPRAVFREMLLELQVPKPTIFDGADGVAERVTRLARALAEFYERSEPWWRIYEREPHLIAAWAGGVDAYYAEMDRLMRAALGELGDDEPSVAVIAAVIGPPTLFALRARGLSSDDAIRLTLDLVLPWLDARAREVAR